MRTLTSRLAALLCVAFAATGGAARAETLNITTEDSPPYNMAQDGKVIGIGTDKVRAAMARAKVEYKIELLPWKRAYESALQSPDTCVYSTTRTPEREKLFKWVGPVAVSEWVLFGRPDRHLDVTTLEQARKLKIGTYNGDVRDSYLRARGHQVETAMDDVLNPKKLLADRIDLWASGKYEGNSIIAKNGWRGKIVPVLAFNKAELYLACNKGVSDALVGKLNAALAAMSRDGTSKAMEQKYENWPD